MGRPVVVAEATYVRIVFRSNPDHNRLVAAFLELGKRTRTVQLGAFTIACTLETALVSLQTWRGVPSHFNIETSFDAMVARTLAAGGVALVVIVVILTFIAFRPNAKGPISMRVAIRVGFVALLGAQIVGAVMIARGMTFVFGGNPQAAYATGGILKPTHAVTMHGVLVLPVLAWLLSFANWSERRRLGFVLAASLAYLVLVAAVSIANVASLSRQQLPLVVATLLALGTASLLVTGAVALFGIARAPTASGIRHS